MIIYTRARIINTFSLLPKPLHLWLNQSFPLVADSLNVQRDITQSVNQMDNLAVSSAVMAFIHHMPPGKKHADDVHIVRTTNLKFIHVPRLPT